MLVKKITVGSRELTFRASALIPKLYRFKFGRDMMQDLASLRSAYKKALEADAASSNSEDAQLSAIDLEIFENLAYIMAYHADPENTPPEPDAWLDGIDGVFSIYEILPKLLDLLSANNLMTSSAKKKRKKPRGK